MKIEHRTKPVKEFTAGNLSAGDCFLLVLNEVVSDTPFMLTLLLEEDCLSAKAINLKTGDAITVRDNDVVIPVEAKVVFET